MDTIAINTSSSMPIFVFTPSHKVSPPEDVGGPPGYMDFLQAMRDLKHEQRADYWRWWGGPFDPHAFSINAANMAIRKLR